MDNISLLIHTCDSYEKFWWGMFYSLDFYWDYSIPVYFANEEKNISDIKFDCKGIECRPNSRIKQILTGKTDKNGFSNRFIKSIEQIPTKYVIYIQEDMWLTRPLSSDLICDLVNFMEENDAESIKIHSRLWYYDSYLLESTENFIQGQRLLKQSEKEGNILLSHNATIWRKDYILKHQINDEDPWTNEIEGSKRMCSDNHQNYLYNIHWHCQPGIAVGGEYSHEHVSFVHVMDEMMNMKLKYKI